MNKMYNLQKIIVALYLINFNLCHGSNWHCALSSMYELYDLEIEYLIVTETYINNEYKRLHNIKKFIEQRKKQNEKELAESYTESSINAFKTILRVKSDWETLKDKMTQTTEIGEFKHELLIYDNIVSGLKAIRRLQIIYELDAHEISNGNIGGHTYQPFDVNDCYDMASLCYDNAEYHCAYWWFVEVYDKNKKDKNELNIDFSTFIIKFIWSSYLVGDISRAMDIFKKYFKQNNEMNESLTNMRYTVWAGNNVFKRNTANDYDKKFYSYSLQKLDSENEVSYFKTACMNTMDCKYPYLECRYYHGNCKYLIIGPLREEILSLVPSMKLYHNVLYDDEIKRIKELAKPKLEKLSIDTNEDISLRKVASFRKQNDQVFETINRRLVQITSKSATNIVDKYVVTNYGVAGHYLPHTKYIDDDHLINSKGRDAIVIFHMDDVPKGGATVLPEVNAHVPSVKGSALVIYNTPMRQLLKFTQYGSCPIIYGDKWTMSVYLKQ
ncbi:prolyl 4-hydroxylase subunit alpha-2-like [Rhopalosiphum maidis]|uniref:prolyl 4-hydroxylase subunit alpha-2-like n=1 Tax=Rhopalosiphum maidis TaxID=43146 RepID=UPI000EFFE885|nr:prolyl 4-hydroxylase subunit alpha-2-like [Rhopalosiphum maidis]